MNIRRKNMAKRYWKYTHNSTSKRTYYIPSSVFALKYWSSIKEGSHPGWEMTKKTKKMRADADVFEGASTKLWISSESQISHDLSNPTWRWVTGQVARAEGRRRHTSELLENGFSQVEPVPYGKLTVCVSQPEELLLHQVRVFAKFIEKVAPICFFLHSSIEYPLEFMHRFENT